MVKYQVNGQLVTSHFQTIVAKCPHRKKDGTECPGFLTTTLQQKDGDSGKLKITFDPKACEVFDGGGTVAMVCGQCGSLLEVRKGLLIMSDDIRNKSMSKRDNMQIRESQR